MSPGRVVLLAQAGTSTNIVFNALTQAFESVMVLLEDPVPRRSFLTRRARKLGLSTVAGQVAFRTLLVPVLRRAYADRVSEICEAHGLNRAPIPARVVQPIGSVNSDEARRALTAARPDIVVVNGTRIISEGTLAAVDAPFINTHTGITPLYRGVHGGYWAMVANDRENCGVTVHLVDAGIDTGRILAQARISPTPADGFVTYPYLQYAAAVPLLLAAATAAAAGVVQPLTAPSGQSRLWSHPTLAEYVLNWVRAASR